MTSRVVIGIHGGTLNSVHSDDGDLEIILFDWDSIEDGDEDSIKDAEIRFDGITEDMVEVW